MSNGAASQNDGATSMSVCCRELSNEQKEMLFYLKK